jgi:hypothetical protein
LDADAQRFLEEIEAIKDLLNTIANNQVQLAKVDSARAVEFAKMMGKQRVLLEKQNALLEKIHGASSDSPPPA